MATLALLMASVHAWWPWPPPNETAEAIGAVLVVLLAGAAWHLPLGPKRWQGWLSLAGFSVLLSAMFWAANQGLDLIKPPGSRRVDAAAFVCGLELWTLLCPGLTCVALAGLARWRVLDSPRR